MTHTTPSSRSADAREERGRQIASTVQIQRSGQRWVVPSQSRPSRTYLVSVEDASCTCPDYEEHGGTCKHQHAVLFWIAWERDLRPEGDDAEAPPSPRLIKRLRKPPAKRNWPAYSASQVHEREYFERLLHDLCVGRPQPVRRSGQGRPPLPIADMLYAAILKVYTRLPNRRVQSDLQQCAARRLVGCVGHYNSISNFLAREETTALLESLIEESAAPLGLLEQGQFAIDSTGLSTAMFGERWFDQKHGKLHSQHKWVTLHALVGTVTNAIVSASVIRAGDATQLPVLIDRARQRFEINQVSGDLAYSSYANHDVLANLGIEAVIPFKVNARMSDKNYAWSKSLAAFVLHREAFAENYARRPNVETTFSMMKKKLGGAVRSRLVVAQRNEALAMCVAHNLCCIVTAIFETGLAPVFWPDSASPPPPTESSLEARSVEGESPC